MALSALIFELAIGVPLGIIAGFYRGKTDTAIMRSADVFYALPTLLLALGLVAACGASKEGCFGGLLKPGMLLVAIVIGVFGWPYIARIIRGQVLSLREKEFIEASRSLGAKDSRIMYRRDPAERARADHRLRDADDPREHPVRGGTVVPRHRGAPGRAVVGIAAQ